MTLRPARAAPEADPAEATLMRALQDGEEAALRRLAQRHTGRILRLAQRLLGNRAEADEVAQEVLLRLWTHAGEWRAERGSVGTWLATIAYRLCLDRLRRRREAPMDRLPDRPDPGAGPLEMLGEAEERALVAASVARLPPRQRAAIVLFYYEEASGEAAAGIMGLSLRAFWSLLQRARQGVQDSLGRRE
ncbi:sigma-70 family RNA polymerase sigma factor [Falsiroseomonas selenitidurans]|nr:sigma-70 family RNA polymerase sigma factor [Falsiroseomonas selenitidurans]